MQLLSRSLRDYVSDMSGAIQGAAQRAIDVSSGSVVRAIVEANASVALWLQWSIARVLSASRASTSESDDLDSWMADFGLVRMPASRAEGTITFGRINPIGLATIRPDALVKTDDGSVAFAVAADPGHPRWSSEIEAYVLAHGVASVDLPVSAVEAGDVGNVRAGTAKSIATSLPGIDSAINDEPMAGGRDAELDDAVRARFQAYINSLSRSTRDAVMFAVASVRQGLNTVVSENIGADGQARSGFFTVTVDDGTGHPAAELLADIAHAIEPIRPVGVMYSVQGPTLVPADVTLRLNCPVMSTARLGATKVAVADSLRSYIDGLPIGAMLSATRIAQRVYETDPGIANVAEVSINGLGVDLAPGPRATVRARLISVS